MLTHIFTRLLIGFQRRRVWMLTGFLLLLAGAVTVTVRSARFTSSLADFFSPRSPIGHAFSLMEKSGLTNRLMLDLDFGNASVDPAQVSTLAAALEAIPGIRTVNFKMPAATEAQAAAPDVTAALPFSEAASTNPDLLARRSLRALLLPVPGLAERARRDPLNLSLRALNLLQRFYSLSGLSFAFDKLVLTSRDGHHALLMLDSSVSSSDGAASAKLLASIRSAAQRFPVKATLVASHVHTVENEAAVKSDVIRVSWISTALLALVFLFAYRGRFSCLSIPLVPLAATLLVTAGLACVFDRILLFALGMGGAVVGLAVDHGIHIFAARGHVLSLRKIARLALPLLAGVTTTAGVFFLLATVDVEAYRQLGLFAGFSLLASFLLSCLILPLVIPERREPVPPVGPDAASRKPVSILWAVGILAVLALVASRAHFRMDVDSFDGTSPATKASERAFDKVWRTSPAPAMLIRIAPDRDRLMRDLRASSAALPTNAFSAALLAPPPETVAANRASWQAASTNGALATLAASWSAAAGRAGLPPAFFEPFFAAKPLTNPPPALLERQLIRQTAPGLTASAIFFADTEANVRAARAAFRGDANAAVVSPTAFRQMLNDDVASRLTTLLPFAFLLVVVLTALFLGSVRKMLLSLLAVIISLLGILAGLTVAGLPINLPVCFAILLLLGLSIDYGIFGTVVATSPDAPSVKRAMLLSYLTTAGGVGAMVFSVHPVLFYTGLTLFIGITLAFLTGRFLVPRLIK